MILYVTILPMLCSDREHPRPITRHSFVPVDLQGTTWASSSPADWFPVAHASTLFCLSFFAISKLPSKIELITKVAAGIKAVPTKVARVIKAPGEKVARAIKLATDEDDSE